MSEHDAQARNLVAKIEKTGVTLQLARDNIERVIFGQSDVVEQTLVTLLAGGHALLIGVPGLAKTRLVETVGQVLGLDDRRVQFTPDLMPSDIIGSELLEQVETGQRDFRFLKGPVFTQLLMADEINRASPRTQSALLQAMQEMRVSVAGEYHALPTPFHVLATQNPLEHEGTYPLPEAQLDRFLMQIDVGYPSLDAERQIVRETTGAQVELPTQIMTSAELQSAQALVRELPIGESVVNTILEIVRSGRPETSNINEVIEFVDWGPGPRASQALILCSRSRAMLDGRLAPSIDDILVLAKSILQHRMSLKFTAQHSGVNISTIIDLLCKPFQ